MKNISKFLVVVGLLLCSALSAFANYSSEKASIEKYFSVRGTDYASVVALAKANPALRDSVNKLYQNSFAVIDTLDGQYTFRGFLTLDGKMIDVANVSNLYFGKGVENYLNTQTLMYVFMSIYPSWVDEIKKCSGFEAKAELSSNGKVIKGIKAQATSGKDPIFGTLPCRIDGIQYALSGGMLYYMQKCMTATAQDIEITKCVLNSDIFFKAVAKMVEAFQTSKIYKQASAKPLIYGKSLQKAEKLKDMTENVPYLYFTSKDGGTVRLNKNGNAQTINQLTATFEYSKDKKSWTEYNWGELEANIKKGDEIKLANSDTVWFRASGEGGKNATLSTSYSNLCYHFEFGEKDSIYAGGNIMSLYDATCMQDIMTEGGFANLFGSCKQLVKAPELPARKLAKYCYRAMFSSCYGLKEAPELPAETMEENCYGLMFNYCKSLVKIPELKVKNLATECFSQMFYNNTKLRVDSAGINNKGVKLVIPITTSGASEWNKFMFSNCYGDSKCISKYGIQMGGVYYVSEYFPFVIGDKGYNSLAEAVKAAQEGDTLKLQGKYSMQATDSVMIPGGVVLDSNGFTLTANGKFGWDITKRKASMIDFNGISNVNRIVLYIVTNLDQPKDTVYSLAINTSRAVFDTHKFVFRGIGENTATIALDYNNYNAESNVVSYAGRIYKLFVKRAPQAKAELGQKTQYIAEDSLFLAVSLMPRIVVETDSTKTLNSAYYTAEPYAFHGGAVYVYDRGTFSATGVNFVSNEATLGAAIYNTGTTNLNTVAFAGNKAKMGGAIYNFDGTININGFVNLVNDSDTWVNEGYKTSEIPQYAVTNWNLGETPDDNEAVLYGYEKFANYGHYANQTITVAKNQTKGSYLIATGDFSNVENKDKFYITGVDGQEDIAVFITGGATKNYDGQGYTLKVNGRGLYLEIGEPLKTLDVAVSSMNKATIYSDKNLVVPAGVRVFGMRWDDSKNMLVCTNSRAYTDGDILPAEMGYVIEAPAATYSFLETEQDASVVSLSELSGVVVETPTDEVEGTVFTLANGYNGVGFYTFVGETLKANKAFYNSTNPNLKGYLGYEEATGIETSLTPTLSSREGVYNLQGVKVNNNYRGVVIKNGKKVLMK